MHVDIIIPAYNPGKDLVEAVSSCYNQSYRNFSVIVIDDNSENNVARLLREFPEVKYIRNDKNLGPAGARNVGMKASSGELISFLDSDDLMHRDKLKLSCEAFAKHADVGMVCGNYRIISNRKKLLRPFYSRPIKISHAALMKQNFVASGSVTVKRDVIKDVGGFDEKLWIAEDYDLWIRISERYNIKYLHDILYYYSVVDGGGSLTQRSDIQKDHDKNIKAIRDRSLSRMLGSEG
tara:strand:+ start:6777 stop:7484 length:708 start_codon:yes stop_codon:yes gene_type:complete